VRADDRRSLHVMTERPRIPLNLPLITDDDRAAVDAVLRTGWIGSGPECEAFEDGLREHLGAEHVVCVSSCTAAIELMLDHLDVDRGARVAVPSWTFPATAGPAALRGAQIVLVDCDRDTLLIDPTSLADVLEQGVEVVIPVHFGGTPLPPEIGDLARRHGTLVIEDAAHAFGASDERGPVRGLGSVGAAYSFHATKNLTCGEGGAIATEDPALVRFVRSARAHGVDRDAWTRRTTGTWAVEDVGQPGRKASLPDLLAGLGRSQLQTFGTRQAHRAELVAHYRSTLARLPGLELLPGVARPGSSNHLMVVALPEDADRAHVVAELAARGVDTGLHYRPLHHLSWFRDHATLAPGGLPACDDLAARAVTLPLYGALTLADVDVVVAALAEALDRG
jgi:dTDP-4-amino-4,6-dideoxygalactose transaminase